MLLTTTLGHSHGVPVPQTRKPPCIASYDPRSYSIDTKKRESFAIPLQRRRGQGTCAYCDNTTRIPCRECHGSGLVAPMNPQKNSVNVNRIINSTWTAMERTCGWRHFHVTQTMHLMHRTESSATHTKKKKKKNVYVLLVATCDDTVRLWCPIDILQCRDVWAPGWLQKSELQSLIQSRRTATTSCETCHGDGSITCTFCSGNAIIDLTSV